MFVAALVFAWYVSEMYYFFLFFATGAYVGKLPKAPGTWGSILACLLMYFLQGFAPMQFFYFLLAFTVFAIWVAGSAIKIFDNPDPSSVVIDEFAGYWWALLGHAFSWKLAIVGLVFFRIFDIWKPYPIRWIDDHVAGGFGVVGDDVLAGIYSNAALWLLVYAGLL